MDTFAFIIHPIDPKRDIQRKYPLLGRIANDWMIEHISPIFPPVYLSEISGIVSQQTGKEIKGWLIACPLSPQHFLKLPQAQVYRKIIECGWLAERLDAKILGLGAFTSVVGDGGITVAKSLDIPVTTGDACTIAVAIEAVQLAARKMDIQIDLSTAAVVGAAGAIGKVCAELLCQKVAELILIGRQESQLHELKEKLTSRYHGSKIMVSTKLEDLSKAHMVVTVTNSETAIIQPDHLKPGCVVCDVARPRDVSRLVAANRQDVLVIDGGMIDVPGKVDFHFDFGFPPGKAYACMAETMALALEGRFEDYTLGKEISISQVKEIYTMISRHGFRLSGFRSFERPVDEEFIAQVLKNAKLRNSN